MFFGFFSNLLYDIISWFPSSPFPRLIALLEHNFFLNMLFGYLNYFFPWDIIIPVFDTWCASIITITLINRYCLRRI